MKTFRQFAHHTGAPPPVGLRALGDRLHLNVWDQFHSARRMIEFFDLLSNAPVDFEPVVTPAPSGTAPFLVNLRITLPNRGFGQHMMGLRWRVLHGGTQLATYENPQGIVPHTFHEPGQYAVEATWRAIGKDGSREVVKTVPIAVHQLAEPGPGGGGGGGGSPKPELAFTGPARFNRTTKRVEIGFRNNGTVPAGGFRVGGQINNISIGEVVYETMAPGQGDTVSFDPGALVPGDYTYNFVLDLYNTVDELDEQDNGFNGTFAIPG